MNFCNYNFCFVLFTTLTAVTIQNDDYSVDSMDDSSLPEDDTNADYTADGAQLLANPKPWPNGVVYFEIKAGDFSDPEKEIIFAMMGKIEDVSCVKFTPVSTQATYILIRRRRDNKPCNSPIGFKNTGEKEFYLNNACMNRNGILHELMHTLGFYHEHNRVDRNVYITVHYDNIEHPFDRNFKKRQTLEDVLVGIGYDFNSILHYEKFAFAKNKSSPTITTNNGEEIRNNLLSDKDIQKINRLYKCDVIRKFGTRMPTLKHTSQHILRTVPANSQMPGSHGLSCQSLGGTCKQTEGTCMDEGKRSIFYKSGCQKRQFSIRGYTDEYCCVNERGSRNIACQTLGGACKQSEGTCMDEGKRSVFYDSGCEKRHFAIRGYADEYCCV